MHRRDNTRDNTVGGWTTSPFSARQDIGSTFHSLAAAAISMTRAAAPARRSGSHIARTEVAAHNLNASEGFRPEWYPTADCWLRQLDAKVVVRQRAIEILEDYEFKDNKVVQRVYFNSATQAGSATVFGFGV
ncbi:MAG: hypothetical protein WA441_12985 [Methyloceanibacter sp.]